MSRIEEAADALLKALKADRENPDRDLFRQRIYDAIDLLNREQPAIPEGFIPYDGSGQPVADDAVVEPFWRGVGTADAVEANRLRWEWLYETTDIIAYRIIHDPARLPDVPWGDYPEARWATLNADGLIETDVWLSAHGTPWDRSPPYDMTHLDPARCKWERPPQRSPRKSIDDARPEEWNRVAAAINDAHVLRMDLQALQRRVASIERSLMHIDRSR